MGAETLRRLGFWGWWIRLLMRSCSLSAGPSCGEGLALQRGHSRFGGPSKSYVSSVGVALHPFVDPITQVLCPLLTFKYMHQTRIACAAAMPRLVSCIVCAEQPSCATVSACAKKRPPT